MSTTGLIEVVCMKECRKLIGSDGPANKAISLSMLNPVKNLCGQKGCAVSQVLLHIDWHIKHDH